MTAYATRQDLYRYAPVRGNLTSWSRPVASSSATTDTLELEGHGLETDDEIQLRAVEGGTLSSPLSATTTYYAIKVDDSRFKVASTAGGAAIDLTTAGVSMVLVVALPVDEMLELYSRFVDNVLPAHAVPLTAPYPITIVALVCELAARRLQLLAGVSSESMKEIEVAAVAQLQRYSQGIPLRDSRVTTSTNKAIHDTAGNATTGDARGWGSGSLP